MKDWKFIKVGNETNTEYKKLYDEMKDIQNEIRLLEKDRDAWQREKEENPDYNVKRQINDLNREIEKYERKLKDVEQKMTISANVKNESIEKQTWSMFKGLTKDAEKEVGNEDIPTEQDLKNWIRMSQQDMKDAQREMEKNKPLGHPDSYREENYGRAKVKYDEAAKAIKKMEEELRQGKYKKVGNKAIVLKDGNVWVVLYANETKSQEFESEAEAREFAKKVGNKVIAGDYYDVVMSGSHFYIYKNGGSQIIGPFNSKQEAQKKIDAIEKERNRIGNETLGQWAKAKPRVINDEITDMINKYNAEIYRLTKKAEQLRRMGQGRSAMEVEKQIEKLGKEVWKLGNKKTGNWTPGQTGKPGTIASIGPAWMHGGTVYGKMDTDESGKHHNEYVKITWLGSGKGGVANYFIDDKMQSDKFGSLDKNELKRWAEQKIGNETKGERKFGKVMGEFERGELKSGSGEKVTDPAQAKAIAYSEADKVDNLKRARNAMNKKVKNSSVREYKDSEGRIAQIDFDSDGTDADLSIYEDERMTRTVESKNFSTIRDAEQYVQSHGFKRVG